MDTRSKILDIAMNLNRIGNWAADGYEVRKSRINSFLDQTSQYLASLDPKKLPGGFKKTFLSFQKEYKKMEKSGKKGPKDTGRWAEMMMTWGNILTHRARLMS